MRDDGLRGSNPSKAWIVRGGREPDRILEEYALGDGRNGFAIISWHLPALTGIPHSENEARRELKGLYRDAHPEVENDRTVGQHVGEIWRFLQIRLNDIVVMPRGEYIAIGIVDGNYSYESSYLNEPGEWPEGWKLRDGRHRMPVEWKTTDAQRGDLGEHVLSCLSNKKRLTVAQFDELSTEWLRQFVGAHSESEVVQDPRRGGREYREPTWQEVVDKQTVFEIDFNRRSRGIKTHMNTQDKLKKAIQSAGLEPRSPAPNGPQFDVAWRQGDTAFVAEVKSVTDENEERQLRLGLGQVLSYEHRLVWPGVEHVRPVLVLERRPVAEYWDELCKKHRVILTWPKKFRELFD